jgi:predicted DNA-binding protein (MmcQ/YjbR family)
LTPEAFEAACLGLPATTFVVQWGDSRVFKVGGKIFALIGFGEDGGAPRYNFKASDMAFELLVEQGLARPAPYLQRAKWVQLLKPDALPPDEIKSYLAQAHALIAARLTRAKRRELGLDAAKASIRFVRSTPGRR